MAPVTVFNSANNRQKFEHYYYFSIGQFGAFSHDLLGKDIELWIVLKLKSIAEQKCYFSYRINVGYSHRTR